jgi:hypothetical protein
MHRNYRFLIEFQGEIVDLTLASGRQISYTTFTEAFRGF